MKPPRLADARLDAALTKDEYRKRHKELQHEFLSLRRDVIEKRIPVVLVFEGWDAAGKGGTIRRLVEPLDPRGYTVHAISKPTQDELDHHYLWRFWTRMPVRGHIAIFDRSWYGRVLVERIEGFATTPAWKRAYQEINEFERLLVDDGSVVAKFFLHISKDEQKRRFEARQRNPLKSWKLNDEDLRNRKKWDQYLVATDDMLAKTHHDEAPWHIIPAEDKRYARIAVMEHVIAAVDRAVRRR